MPQKITMNNINEVQFAALLSTLSSYVKNNGVDKTIERLQEEEVVFEDKYITQVLNAVALHFQTNIKDIIYKRVRGEDKYAVGFCVYYLYKVKSLREINDIVFKYKDKSVLSRYKSIIEDLHARHKSDLPYIKIKEKLDKIILPFTYKK